MDKKIKIVLFSLTVVTLLFLLLKEREIRYVKLGTSLPMSGQLKEIGKAVVAGSEAYFKYTNSLGGVKGKEIKFTYFDDKYEPEITKSNIESLLNAKDLFAFYSFVGTPTVKNILPIVDSTDIPFISPFTGASFIRNSSNEGIVNFRKSYLDEVEALVEHLHHRKKLSKFAILYQNDDYGEEGYLSTVNVLRSRDLELVAEGTYRRNTLSIRHALQEIKKEKPEVIIMVGAYKPNAHFIKKAKQEGLESIFCILSFSDADATVKELEGDTKNIIFSQVVPSYTDIKIPIVAEYQKLMKKFSPDVPLGFVSLESFIGAKILVNAIEESQSFKREDFLTSIKNVINSGVEAVIFDDVYLFEYNNYEFEEIVQ